MVHVASIVGALSGCRGMAWFSRLCVRLTGLSQLRHGKIPFSHMEGVPTLCPEIPIYTPGRFAFPFLILFLAYIGACADWRGSPALSKALEAVGGKGLGWVCSEQLNSVFLVTFPCSIQISMHHGFVAMLRDARASHEKCVIKNRGVLRSGF